MLDEGRIIFAGTPDEIQHTSDPVVQEFIRGLERHYDGVAPMVPRAQAERRFTEESVRLQRHRVAFAVILITLENMDEINSRTGYETGQMLLSNLAVQIHAHLRATDTCSRYGFDKILIILPDTNMDQAGMVCAKLATAVNAARVFETERHPEIPCSINAGFAEAREGGRLEELIADAEARQRPCQELCMH